MAEFITAVILRTRTIFLTKAQGNEESNQEERTNACKQTINNCLPTQELAQSNRTQIPNKVLREMLR